MKETDPFNEHFRRMEVYLRNKRFGVDIDGTSADSAVPVALEATRILKCNPEFRASDIDGWGAIRDLAIRNGMSETDAEELDYKLWFTPEILNQAPPVEGATSLLFRMQLYCELPPQFISSREPKMRQHTIKWFECMPWVNPEQIHIREDESIKGIEHKAQLTRQLGLTHFLEDSIDHARYLLDNTDVHVILMPYGKTPCDMVHPRLTVIRNQGSQSLWPVYRMIAKGHIFSGSV